MVLPAVGCLEYSKPGDPRTCGDMVAGGPLCLVSDFSGRGLVQVGEKEFNREWTLINTKGI